MRFNGAVIANGEKQTTAVDVNTSRRAQLASVNAPSTSSVTRLNGASPLPSAATSPGRNDVSACGDETLERAKRSRSRVVTSFASDLEKDLDVAIKGHTAPALTSHSHDDVFAISRGRDTPDLDVTLDSRAGNVSLDEILENITHASMTSPLPRSKRGSRRHLSSNSSTHSLEPPHEKLFRLLRAWSADNDVTDEHEVSMDKTLDSTLNQSKNDSTLQNSSLMSDTSAPLSPGVTSPRELQLNDSLNGDVDESQVSVRCRNSRCRREASLEQARRSFKNCQHCFTPYCSRACREEHRPRHKRRCLSSRIDSACKHVIKRVNANPMLGEEFSKVARTGFIQRGRGCVTVVFASCERAEEFLEREEVGVLDSPLAFVSAKDIEDSQLFLDQLFELSEMCKTYNPEVKYVINCIILTKHAHVQRRRSGPVSRRCAKLRLTSAQMSPKLRTVSQSGAIDNDTLILTGVPGAELTENMETEKARQVFFANVQLKLRERGVHLRHQYRDVYDTLCTYVAENTQFAPITLFPVDGKTGKPFLCLIMPNAEPEIEWINSPGLLEELGMNTDM